VLAFASAFVGIRHEPVAGVLFMLALGLLGAALFTFAREVWIGLNEFDHYGETPGHHARRPDRRAPPRFAGTEAGQGPRGCPSTRGREVEAAP